MTKSTHRAEVIKIDRVEPHPNADTLGIVKVWGYSVCVRLQDWKEGDIAVYVQPDSILPDKPEYAFLDGKLRIKVKKLRGVVSQGLLLPAPAGMLPGEDAAGVLGITRYEPPLPGVNTSSPDSPNPPDIICPVYDVENWYRYQYAFTEGEKVIITEKIHGASARFYNDGQTIHVGSRKRWVLNDGKNAWSQALNNCPWLVDWLKRFSGYVVYGEIFGPIQDLKYDRKETDLRVFDVYHAKTGSFINFCEDFTKDLLWVPVLAEGSYSDDLATAFSEGQSTLGGCIREGVVIRSLYPSFHPEIGRKILKVVSNEYLQR